jgi:hypothetical protein
MMAKIIIVVDVFDRKKLRRAALVTALNNGLSAHEWRDMRRGDPLSAELRMMFDPGDRDGIGVSIEDSVVA